MKEKTVRELGGEIWAVITMMQNSADSSSELAQVNFIAIQEICDLTMGILARHIGTIIIDDEGLPVTPLPPLPLENTNN